MNAPAKIADPVRDAYLKAHAAREVYPTGHVFSMTRETDEKSRALSVATCECGVKIKLLAIRHEEMDAAIEAHWQRFDHADDRGQPVSGIRNQGSEIRIEAEERAVAMRPPGSIGDGADLKADPIPPDHAASPAPASAHAPCVGDAGATLEPAPNGGGDEDLSAEALAEADDILIEWPSYAAFLDDKIVTAPLRGIEVPRSELHDWLKPHCKDLVVWALRLGCAAIFANFGLHKTAMQLEWCRQLERRFRDHATLCVLPLGVRHGFIDEAAQLGMEAAFIRTTAEFFQHYDAGVRHFLTNYESIREAKIEIQHFNAVSLDEASVLRSFGSKTFQEFLPLFAKVPFKLVATATPSPNRYKELIHYSGFLGIMDTGQALTRFFQRNSEKAGDLTLYPHKSEEFWMWIHSWAIFLQKPSDLCDCSCHNVRSFGDADLGASRLLNGCPEHSGTERGGANATAETSASLHQRTFSLARSEAADASGQGTAENIRLLTELGAQWSPGSTATEKTTPTEESKSASAGASFQTSSPIWDNPQREQRSIGSTTTGTTNPETVVGQPVKSKRATRDATSGSATGEESRPSPVGPKSAASTISCSTLDTNTAGPQPKCSENFCRRCKELDEGYEFPPLKITWHEVPADHSKAEPERDGQGVMFRDISKSLSAAAHSRRDSLGARIEKMMAIIAADPAPHRILWHDLEAEREAIEAALPDVVTISGSKSGARDLDERERRLRDFETGRIKYFGTKPTLSGSGSNFQYHCHKAIYVALPGYGYKFNDFLQSLHRLQRFGQRHPVEVDIIYAEDERAGRAALEEKWARDAAMRERMSEIIRTHGLNALPLRDALARSIGCQRVEVKGENFVAINNDCVAECRSWPDASVDQIVTSVPFSNHYEYSASYNDFGHTDDNAHFWAQMNFLTAELLRMLKPGRLACIHVKDRVLFGAVTGQGVPTISPFHAEALMHYRAHGFQYMGMITVVTDVVRENNQTYRLGWSENCKDGSKMGVGCPEYVLLFRKPQSDRTRGYADVPVTKEKRIFARDMGAAAGLDGDASPVTQHWSEGEQQAGDYSRARWQIDAHGFWRSSGDRLLTPEEFADCSSAGLAKLFSKTSAVRTYDYEAHVRIGEKLERQGTLPATFMAIAPGSAHPDVWTDIARMRTLNMLQERRGAELHLCPLQFDIVDRLIERYSNPGELIFDPFGGIGTVPYRALLKGRRGAMTELSAPYFLDAVHYLRMAEEKMSAASLFDLAAFDKVNTPPTALVEAGEQ